MKRHRCAGLTSVELMVASSILGVLLYALVSATSVVSKTLDTNERSSDVASRARQNLTRLSDLMRSSSLTSLRARSSGTWIVPVDGTGYDAVRFQSLTGAPSASTTPLTGASTIELVREPSEQPNGKDDNGDGLVDEGRLWQIDPSGARTCLAAGVESFVVTKTGRELRIRIGCGGRDAQRHVLRNRYEQSLLLRNN